MACGRLRSRCNTTNHDDTRVLPSTTLSSPDGETDEPQPGSTTITIDVSFSWLPRRIWSRGRQGSLPDSPDSGQSAESGESGESTASTVDGQPSHVIIPDGGSRAWLTVTGGFFICFFMFGILNAFGSFQNMYTENVAGDFPWTDASPVCLCFCGGLVSGPLFDKLGSRLPMTMGAGLVSASLLGSAFSTEFLHYLVCQGVFFGSGIALLYYPAMGAVTEWFSTKRPLALGIAASGASVGGVIWSSALPVLANQISHRILFIILTGIASLLLCLGCWLTIERQGAAGYDESSEQVQPSQRTIQSAIFESRFVALASSLVILYTGILIPCQLLEVYAKELDIQGEVASNLIAFTYSGSVIGRIGSGLLADTLGCFNILVLTSSMAGAVTLAWIPLRSAAGLIAFSVLFGILSGGLVPLASACVARTTRDMGHIGLRIGVLMAFCAVAALGSGPLGAFILHKAG
ncbi:Major facilitator superfamily domain, general substrate transporter [Metarhizium album ARSEF 1941]|uniref:Major facilitator superfamily domain, general substrate transporter n=1 Tax=Metarhizium album (strain ARSEF 1941) TaxID=1081103 RepID=A0A0B2WLG7_METAS|nr:Major facilitator superfamily domain, general substrate transporter [Metarhizium album ARSEF 1941]KHN94317.1 Major facilitator superfamily domain, general substrate transporter [Metarhizium album ARSEF 1941]